MKRHSFFLTALLAISLVGCGGSGGRNKPSEQEIGDNLTALYGEAGAFDALVLALDAGYAVNQIVSAVQDGTLGADGSDESAGLGLRQVLPR